MKTIHVPVLVFLIFSFSIAQTICASIPPEDTEKEDNIQINESENIEPHSPSMPFCFVENRGQIDDEKILFYDPGGTSWFAEDGIWLNIVENESPTTYPGIDSRRTFNEFDICRKGTVLQQKFLNSNKIIGFT